MKEDGEEPTRRDMREEVGKNLIFVSGLNCRTSVLFRPATIDEIGRYVGDTYRRKASEYAGHFCGK